MRFLTSFYWQEGENATSLVLQQIRTKKGRDSLLFACVCDSRDFCSRLAEGFHGEMFCGYGRRGRADLGIFLTQLQKMAAKEKGPRTGADFSCAGILCLGSEFLLFGQGGQRVYLLNRGFRGNRIKKLTGTDRCDCREEGGEPEERGGNLKIQKGIMESGISILLATEPFYARLTEQMLLNCLGEVRDEKQASLRLKELGEFGKSRGGQNLGAVLIHAQSDFWNQNCEDNGF